MAWLLSWLVQGLAVALVTRAAMRMLPRLSAATRYAIWWAAVVLVLLLPVLGGVTRVDRPPVEARAAANATDTPTADSVAPKTHAPSAAPIEAPSRPPVRAERIGNASFADRGSALARLGARIAVAVPPLTLPRLPDWVLAVVIGAWLGTAMLGLAQLAYSVSMVRRLKRSCRRLTTPRESELPLWSSVRHRGRAVRVRASTRLRTAAVLGLYRPIIAVPRDIATSLSAAELDQVILHEYAHVQRFDDWGKLLQVTIGAFFGWHPAVRVMMREIDLEREAACDDWVVGITAAPRAYARCLTKMAGFLPAPESAATIPYAASTSHIRTRIERLLAAGARDQRRGAARFAPLPALTAIAALTIVTLCTVRALPVATERNHVEGETTLANAASAASAPTSTRPTDIAQATEAGAGELQVATASMMPLSLPFSGLVGLAARSRASAGVAALQAGAAPSAMTGPASPLSAVATPPGTALVDAPPHVAHADTPLDATSREAHASPVVERGARAKDAERGHTTQHDGFALGPVVNAAADSTSIAMASAGEAEDDTWRDVAREATVHAMGVGARSVGSATRTATSTAAENVKNATAAAASHVKSSSAKTARVLGRVTRKVLPF